MPPITRFRHSRYDPTPSRATETRSRYFPISTRSQRCIIFVQNELQWKFTEWRITKCYIVLDFSRIWTTGVDRRSRIHVVIDQLRRKFLIYTHLLQLQHCQWYWLPTETFQDSVMKPRWLWKPLPSDSRTVPNCSTTNIWGYQWYFFKTYFMIPQPIWSSTKEFYESRARRQFCHQFPLLSGDMKSLQKYEQYVYNCPSDLNFRCGQHNNTVSLQGIDLLTS
jgi:hypothetical protein